MQVLFRKDKHTNEIIAFLPEIPVNRSVFESEIDDIVNECYTTNDFINECKGHENLAEDLFNFIDWQHPDIQDFLEGYDDEKQFFEEYGFQLTRCYYDEISESEK